MKGSGADNRRRELPPDVIPLVDVIEEPNEGAGADCTVLVINSSRSMAREITIQLTLSMPGISIMYAPSVHVAALLLARRHVDLVVSSPVLPDGTVEDLQSSLEDLETPPDVVVVGNFKHPNSDMLGNKLYEMSILRRLAGSGKSSKIGTKISSLGADLRNDLNNPLQEIVAMVFVAQSIAGSKTVHSNTKQALTAIEKAAHNMAQVVNNLEEKIRQVLATAG